MRIPCWAKRACVARMVSNGVSASPNSTRAQRSPICLRNSRSSSLARALTRCASLVLAGSNSSSRFDPVCAVAMPGRAPPIAASPACLRKSRRMLTPRMITPRVLLRSALGYVVPNDLPALHHKFDSLKLGDIRQRVAGHGDHIGELALVDGSDLVLPSERFGVNHASALDSPCRCQAGALHQPLKVESLCPMRVGRAIHSTAHHDFDSPGGGRHRRSLLKNGNNPKPAAGGLSIVVVHIRLGIANQGRIVVEPLGNHHIDLLLIQAKSVLDGVAAGDDGVFLPLAPIDMAASLLAKSMRL